MAFTKRSLDLKLIDLVRQNPILYDPKNESHMNFDQREVVWQKIGDALNKPSTTCRDKWSRLRNNFRKSHKLRKSRGIELEKLKPLKYDKELGFIIPFLNDEDNRNLKNKCTYSGEDSLSNHSLMNSDLSSNILDYASARPSKRLCIVQPTSTSSITSACNKAKEYSSITPQETNVTGNSEDSLVDFFINMARTVKSFPLEKQLEIKAKLFELVHSAEVEMYSTT